MEYTKNLKLYKPSYDDDVDIQVINNNMDIIDNRVANVRNYLPLTGGTMVGDITLQVGVGLNYDSKHWLNFQTTNFKDVSDTTLAMKGNRLKFYTPSTKEFVIQDSGVYWNGKSLLTEDDKDVLDIIKESKLSYGTGYTKLNNGLLLQWGTLQITTDDYNPTISSYEVTLPLPFADTGYCVMATKSTTNSTFYSTTYEGITTYSLRTTAFRITALPKRFANIIHWLAIGKGVL